MTPTHQLDTTLTHRVASRLSLSHALYIELVISQYKLTVGEFIRRSYVAPQFNNITLPLIGDRR